VTDDFRWNEWNLDHATRHGVSREEAQYVVRRAKPPYPREVGNEKWLVWGRGAGGRFLQVIYSYDPDETIYILHSRPMTESEKRRYRR